jgi:hypothetical protein
VAGLFVAAVVDGSATVGVAVGIGAEGEVVVVTTGALLIDPASAPTVDELAVLPGLCETLAAELLEYELEITLTWVGVGAAVRVTTRRVVVVVAVRVTVRVVPAVVDRAGVARWIGAGAAG